jgi:hypothetical protein
MRIWWRWKWHAITKRSTNWLKKLATITQDDSCWGTICSMCSPKLASWEIGANINLLHNLVVFRSWTCSNHHNWNSWIANLFYSYLDTTHTIQCTFIKATTMFNILHIIFEKERWLDWVQIILQQIEKETKFINQQANG